jgi:hypothetical protein
VCVPGRGPGLGWRRGWLRRKPCGGLAHAGPLASTAAAAAGFPDQQQRSQGHGAALLDHRRGQEWPWLGAHLHGLLAVPAHLAQQAHFRDAENRGL